MVIWIMVISWPIVAHRGVSRRSKQQHPPASRRKGDRAAAAAV
jgi:hypothetical protein